MKVWLLALLLLGVLVSAALVAAQSEPKRSRRSVDSFEDVDDPNDDGDDDEDEDDVDEEAVEEDDRINPCLEKSCKRGEMCTVDKRLKARCICIPKCDVTPEGDHRYEVCARHNVTYPSECQLNRDHCLCRRRLEGCSREGVGKIRLDYYGACQELTPCNARESKQFPARMREWLFLVMKQLAVRAEIPNYLDFLEKARHEGNHSHAVIWKFCDLDVDPADRFVTRRELLHTVQSLKAMEHCLVPFLDTCDADSDGQITLLEWGTCLQLEAEVMKDECKSIRRAAGREQQ